MSHDEADVHRVGDHDAQDETRYPRKLYGCGPLVPKVFRAHHKSPVREFQNNKYLVLVDKKKQPAVVRVCESCYSRVNHLCEHAKHENLGVFRLGLFSKKASKWKRCSIVSSIRNKQATAPCTSASSVPTAAATSSDSSVRPDWYIAFEDSNELPRLTHRTGSGVLATDCKQCLDKAASPDGLQEICDKCALLIGTTTEHEVVRTSMKDHMSGCHVDLNKTHLIHAHNT